jgi:hypothetical protein
MSLFNDTVGTDEDLPVTRRDKCVQTLLLFLPSLPSSKLTLLPHPYQHLPHHRSRAAICRAVLQRKSRPRHGRIARRWARDSAAVRACRRFGCHRSAQPGGSRRDEGLDRCCSAGRGCARAHCGCMRCRGRAGRCARRASALWEAGCTHRQCRRYNPVHPT